jgi:hypothetical protein
VVGWGALGAMRRGDCGWFTLVSVHNLVRKGCRHSRFIEGGNLIAHVTTG